jgi:hypothetical protein
MKDEPRLSDPSTKSIQITHRCASNIEVSSSGQMPVQILKPTDAGNRAQSTIQLPVRPSCRWQGTSLLVSSRKKHLGFRTWYGTITQYWRTGRLGLLASKSPRLRPHPCNACLPRSRGGAALWHNQPDEHFVRPFDDVEKSSPKRGP